MEEHAHIQSKAHIVSVNMGYGHERAAFALRGLAKNAIITANDYPGIPEADRRLWRQSRKGYEFVSRLQPIPLLGKLVFGAMDAMQKIDPFYPRRDLSHPTLQVQQNEFAIHRRQLGKHLIKKLAQNPKPLISTFFLPAFAAEAFDYPEDIYLVVCDADCSRAWANNIPQKSRIKYLVPNGRVVERLKLYGVPEKNIFLTGFPLPPELIGTPDAQKLKADLRERIRRLDPHGIFTEKYAHTLEMELGTDEARGPIAPPTIAFCIGGAGAQRKLALTVLQSLAPRLKNGELIFRLIPGTNPELRDLFTTFIAQCGLQRELNSHVFIDWYSDRPTYFREFSKLLRSVDVVWTKPSEMSFYTGAGLPIIMAPSIGSQEVFNRQWLKSVGGGVTQNDPRYTNEWFFDWLHSGGLARMAWNGYIEAPTHGTYRIHGLVSGETFQLPRLPLII